MFPCTMCGECCKKMGNTPWGKNLALSNGVCKWLDMRTNRCLIYSKRPLVCNVDAYYEKYYASRMSREDFYLLNIEQCNDLKNR